MHAEIIAVGTELLMGELVDTNSGFLASELAKVGVELRWSSKVSDDPELLFEAISQAFQRADVTITTGGLGPTSDDPYLCDWNLAIFAKLEFLRLRRYADRA